MAWPGPPAYKDAHPLLRNPPSPTTRSLQSAASDIIRGNERYQLPPGLLASDTRSGTAGGAGGPPDQGPTPWPSAAAPGAAALAAKLAVGAVGRRGSGSGSGEGLIPAVRFGGSSGGGAAPGLLGARGRALLGRLAAARPGRAP
jgi:hypothetical protein